MAHSRALPCRAAQPVRATHVPRSRPLMSSASIHDKLTRVRRPRVHITYQVETEGARVQRELPFVMGVMGDFSGNQPTQAMKPLKHRRFVAIDRDNFNEVMSKFAPGSRFQVKNTLKDHGSEMAVALKFN